MFEAEAEDEYDAAFGPGGRGNLVSSVVYELENLGSGVKKFKGEDFEDMYNPYHGLEKSRTLQEASAAFNNPQTVKMEPTKCLILITKLIFLLAQGEKFEGRDAEGVFFAVTKLFQSTNTALRRMTYLFIKEVSESTDPENVIIVIQSLTKDMTSNADLYRANAIRVLCKIIDAGILGQIDRYIREAIVDRNPLVSASALISSNQMIRDSQKMDVIKRWSNEIQEAVNSKSPMVQLHALSLFYEIKKHDRLAIERLVSQHQRSSLGSPFAMCLVIRFASKLLHDDVGVGANSARATYELLENCLHNRNEMVVLEAARAMCRLRGVGPQDILPAVTVLQKFLSSNRPTTRFAAIRTLHEVSLIHPSVLSGANRDIELLINDRNKSVATLAITTLLKSGAENRVDKLMKQISTFISEIADDFRIVVVRAVHSLCLKYPAKHGLLLLFLSSTLRDEGGFQFKKVVVDTILQLIAEIPECKTVALEHLCEFIEDCEFTSLNTQILHLLGELGPTTTNPAKYIRFIYNRIILENAHVRAAAISALSKFGLQVESLTDSVIGLLRRSLTDEDDDVRDRAVICLYALESISSKSGPTARAALIEPLPIAPKSLSKAVELYSQNPASGPIAFDSLPIIEDEEYNEPDDADKGGLGGLDINGSSIVKDVTKTQSGISSTELPGQALLSVPELAHLGTPFRCSKPVPLTESETEYLVSCEKHIFDNHVVLQFNIKNTLNDQRLRNVSAVVEDANGDGWEVEFARGCDEILFNQAQQAFVLLNRPENVYSGTLTVDIKFNAQECDPKSGEPYDSDDLGEEEDYSIEPLELETTDFIAKVSVKNFKSAWETMGNSNEVMAKFDLPHYKTLNDAVAAVIEYLGLRPCEGTDSIHHNATTQNVLLSGMFLGGIKVFGENSFHAVKLWWCPLKSRRKSR